MNKSSSEYGSEYSTHCLDIYKLYVEMADRISARRQSANTFFLTINTTLITAIGFLYHLIELQSLYYLLISLLGILNCYIWYRLVLSYKNLNSAKFKVIHKIEEKLPLSPYKEEWNICGNGSNEKLYHPFTSLEIKIPWFFLFLYSSIILIIVLAWIIKFFMHC